MKLPWWLSGKEPTCNAGDVVWSLGWEDPLEKEMQPTPVILGWRIPWTEEPGGLQTMGSQRVGLDWATNAFAFPSVFLWPPEWICVNAHNVMPQSLNIWLLLFALRIKLSSFLWPFRSCLLCPRLSFQYRPVTRPSLCLLPLCLLFELLSWVQFCDPMDCSLPSFSAHGIC